MEVYSLLIALNKFVTNDGRRTDLMSNKVFAHGPLDNLATTSLSHTHNVRES